MTSPTTDKAARLFTRLTARYDTPGSKVSNLIVSNDTDAITLEAFFTNGRHLQHDLDPTRGVLDLSRQAQALINQHIETKG
jgi:hypothetical protein